MDRTGCRRARVRGRVDSDRRTRRRTCPGGEHGLSVLSDRTIRELLATNAIVIDPLDLNRIQPSSVDLCLGNRIRVFTNNHRFAMVDVRAPADDLTEMIELEPDQPFILHPHEFVLGITHERVRLPHDIVGRLEGKSSLGRLGLLIHSTAGFVDPGWSGRLTLELANILNLPITLYAGMPIAQISFMQLTTEVDRPYGSASLASKYQGDEDPAPSRFHRNFRN